MALAPTAADAAELDRILAGSAIHAVYQPIVDLERHAVVAQEALARGPEGSPLRRPERLFAVARACGRVEELDWGCRVAALRGAMEGGLRPPHALFVNIEPDLADCPAPAALRPSRRTIRLPANGPCSSSARTSPARWSPARSRTGRLRYALTYDRGLVCAAARTVMARIGR